MKTEKSSLPRLGLDVGTSRICLAYQNGDGFEYQTQLNAFVSVPYSKMTMRVLERAGVPHAVQDSQIVVYGNESDQFADLLNVETRRTMSQGVLNSSEPDSLSMLRQIAASMLEGSKERSKICFTVPAAPLGSEDRLTYHEASIRQMLAEMGHQASSISEGLAVIYAELESSNYSGIGISCGGGLCNVCLAYMSVPVLTFSIPKAGDYIDRGAAGVLGARANHVRLIKEQSFHVNGHYADKTLQALGVYYDDMIHNLVDGIKQAFENAKDGPKINRPLPMVLSGGTALPQGFRERFEKIVRESELPIPISEIRMAADPLHSSAKGALVAALTDM